MGARVRDDDQRPDALLEESGRIASRLGLAIGWTSGIRGEKAKMAAGEGRDAWKRAAPLTDAEQAAQLFKKKCRTRNPVCAARASALVLVELDGDDDLLDQLGVALPATATARSRRGLHRYYRPAPSCGPGKFQIDTAGVAHWEDGYLVLTPALHPVAGVVYSWVEADVVNELPADTYQLLRRLADETEAAVVATVEGGGKVTEGHRDKFIFLEALELSHAGRPEAEIVEAMVALSRERCEPPLSEQLVRKQVRGAIKRALIKPRADWQLRVEAKQALIEMVNAAEPQTETPEAPAANGGVPTRPGVVGSEAKRRLYLVPASSVKARALQELITGLLPIGTITNLAGVGGLGKSSLACQWIASLTRGELLEQGDAIVVSFEDAWAEILRPRLEAAEAKLEHVHFVGISDASLLVLPRDVGELERLAREASARLVLIDPISASIDLRLNAHQERDVRVVLGQIAGMAERTKTAVLAVAHLNKSPTADIYLRVNGSSAFYNSARSVVTVTRDPDEPDAHRLVAQHKANYRRLAPVQRHRIEEVVLPYPDPESGKPIITSRLVYVEDAEGVDPFAVLEHQEPKQRTKRDDAGSFLLAALSDGQWHDRQGLVTLAQAVGLSRKTLDRAAEALPIERDKGGFPASARWRLAGGPTPIPQELAQLDENA